MKNLRNTVIALAVLLGSGSNAGESNELHFRVQNTDRLETVWREFAVEVAEHGDADLRISSIEGSGGLEEAGLVELQLHDAIDVCNNGWLNILPLAELIPEESILNGGFIANGVQPCAIGHSIRADVIAFDHGKVAADYPLKLTDFFNLDDYPGKRVLKKTARGLFEQVLIANGYTEEKIYPTLTLDAGWQEIRTTLSTIQNDIIWVDNDQQALDLLESGVAAFAAISNHNLVRRVFKKNGDKYLAENRYGVIWQGAIAHMSMLGIPKSENAELALRLLRLAIDPERNIKRSTAFGYAPVRTDQLVMIKDRYRRVLPVGRHLESIFWGNARWWRDNGQPLESRFASYLGEL